MNTWQGAAFLAKEELKKIKWKHVFTVIFIVYLLIFIIPMFADAMEGKDAGRVNWTLDFISITLLPIMGLASTQPMGFYWKTDDYTKKLVSWRILPISAKQLGLGKLLILLLNQLPANIVYFILYYLGARSLNVEVEPQAFALFAVFWIGYSTTIGVIYIYFEMSYSGKHYFWICMIMTLLFLIIMIATSIMFQTSLVVQSYETFARGNWWLALLSIVIAIAISLLTLKQITKRLKTRNYIS